MSTPTKVVISTIAVSVILSLLLVVQFAVV